MDKPLIEADTIVNADTQQVWRALTAGKSAMFMGADVDTDWQEGSPISFTTPLGRDKPDEQTIAEYRRNWDVMLDGLKQAAEESAFTED